MTDSVSLYNKILSFINNEYDSIIPNNNNISNNDISYDKANDKTLMNKANDDITNDTPGSTEVLENLIHMDTDNVNGGIAMETLTENLVGGNNVNNTSDNIISSYNSNDDTTNSSHNATKANDKQKTLSNTDITKEIYETTIKQFDTNLLEGGDGTKHDKNTNSDTKVSDHNTSNDKANDNTKYGDKHKNNDKNNETQDDKHKDKDKSKESSSDSSDDESKDDLTKNITININNTGTENINEESSSSSSSDEEEEIIQEPINNNKDISHIPTDTTKASDHNTSNDKHNTSKTNDTKANDDKKDTSSRDTTKTSDHNTNNDKTNDDKKDDKNKINKANDTSISSYNNDDDNIGDITILNVGQPGDDNDINSIIFGSDSEDTEYDCSNSSNSSCDEYSDDEGEVSKFAMFLKKFQNKDHIDYEDNTTVTGGNNTQELEVLTMFPYLVR